MGDTQSTFPSGEGVRPDVGPLPPVEQGAPHEQASAQASHPQEERRQPRQPPQRLIEASKRTRTFAVGSFSLSTRALVGARDYS